MSAWRLLHETLTKNQISGVGAMSPLRSFQPFGSFLCEVLEPDHHPGHFGCFQLRAKNGVRASRGGAGFFSSVAAGETYD